MDALPPFLLPSLNGIAAGMAVVGVAVGLLYYLRRARPLKADPEKVGKRVNILALVDGVSLLAVGGLSLLVCLVLFDMIGLAISAVIITAGVLVLTGRQALAGGNPDGIKRMVTAQLLILGGGIIYIVIQWVSLSPDSQLASLAGVDRDTLVQAGVDPVDLAKLVGAAGNLLYATCFLTLITAQGALLGYYHAAGLSYHRQVPL